MSFRLVMAVFALLASAALLAQATSGQSAATMHAATKPGDAKAGQAKAATCTACHGLDGNPASSQYPKLAGQQAAYIERQVHLFKEQKRSNPVMMGFVTTLTDQDIADIAAYFASKSSRPGVADSKLVARGESIYRGGNAIERVPACMACHGPDGRGNPGAIYPQLAGQWADYIAAKLKDFRDGKSWGDDGRAQIMPIVAKGLSDADITAVASYIEGLHTAETGATTAAK